MGEGDLCSAEGCGSCRHPPGQVEQLVQAPRQKRTTGTSSQTHKGQRACVRRERESLEGCAARAPRGAPTPAPTTALCCQPTRQDKAGSSWVVVWEDTRAPRPTPSHHHTQAAASWHMRPGTRGRCPGPLMRTSQAETRWAAESWVKGLQPPFRPEFSVSRATLRQSKSLLTLRQPARQHPGADTKQIN